MYRTHTSSLFIVAAMAAAASASVSTVCHIATAAISLVHGVLLGAWYVARSLAEDFVMRALDAIAPRNAALLIGPMRRLIASTALARSITKRSARIEAGWRMCPSI